MERGIIKSWMESSILPTFKPKLFCSLPICASKIASQLQPNSIRAKLCSLWKFSYHTVWQIFQYDSQMIYASNCERTVCEMISLWYERPRKWIVQATNSLSVDRSLLGTNSLEKETQKKSADSLRVTTILYAALCIYVQCVSIRGFSIFAQILAELHKA